MNTSLSKDYHGSELKLALVDDHRAEALKELALSLPDITLSSHHLCDLELIATGAFSPLEGFMVRADYESVVDRMRLQDDTIWPVPVCLDIPKNMASALEAGQSIALRDPEGFLLAVMHVEDVWPADKTQEAQGVYGTTDHAHPGVRHLFNDVEDYYVGGCVEVVNLPLHFDFKQLRRTPKEVRQECQKLRWQQVVGFQTNAVIHRPQFEITLEAMRQARANLLLMPVVGVTRTEEFDYYTRVRCYRRVMRNYPPDSHVLSLLPHFSRWAGPREVVLGALVARNYGCTHFAVYHDYANPCREKESGYLYPPGEVQKVLDDCIDDLDIKILRFDEMVYLPFEDVHRSINDVPEDVQTIKMTGQAIRERIRTGHKVPGWASFPEVLDELRRCYPPPAMQGFTIFCTGLSGAGKSTIAKVLFSKMLEIGERPVTLLDGDIVRHNLSSELTFSKEHRDINVRRIGFVASEITKNRGIAICAPIAPYERTRNEIRRNIEDHGGFIEVHVATPLEECEKRDRKGMYAKARAGLIKGYTGIDDPYEAPQEPELRIDTTHITPDEAAHQILLFIRQKGYI